MTITVLGSDGGDRPRALTLAQFYEAHNGVVPEKSYVRVVFAPAKIPNWSLVTDHDFRVNIHRSSGLYSVLNECIAKWADTGASLVVFPNREVKGAYTLGLDQSHEVEWRETDWGYFIDLPEPTPEPTKSPASEDGRQSGKRVQR